MEHKKHVVKQNEVPAQFTIKFKDVLILYYNLYRAKELPELGFQDADNQFRYTLNMLERHSLVISHKELEGLLWACVQLDELAADYEVGEGFWHPEKSNVNTFIQRMLHHKQFRFYFDKIYNFFRAKKPKQGVPPEAIIGSVEEE